MISPLEGEIIPYPLVLGARARTAVCVRGAAQNNPSPTGGRTGDRRRRCCLAGWALLGCWLAEREGEGEGEREREREREVRRAEAAVWSGGM
eukprot:COSAG02_NODE_452_length_22047_cov_20.154502_9_plen_92_part_00